MSFESSVSFESTVAALLPQVVEISRQAGDAIMDIYQQEDLGVSYKQDESPLTLADMASHRCIESGLQQLQPEYPVLSEESGKISWQVRQQWQTYWLVDPLDGTKEFVKRNGEFTVNIALIHQGKPVMGVVYAPVLDELYYGAEGLGAFFVVADKPAEKLELDPEFEPECWRIVGSRSHGASRLETFAECLPEYRNVPMGSSLKLCMVAANRSDLYVRFGPTSEWDTAAAQAVVEQAGGAVLNDQLEPLAYNHKESLLNPEFVVCQKKNAIWTDTFAKLVEPVVG